MERRTALKIVSLSALAPAALCLPGNGQQPENTGARATHQLQFFTEQEREMLDELMEMIIPADTCSPGAKAAKVSLFADLMVATSGDEVQQQWRRGLQLMREETAHSSLEQTLAKAAANEGDPKTHLERFFSQLKEMTVNGYYTSAIGIHRDLQYQGNTYLNSFPGCNPGTNG